ncbi:MAG: nicotinate (nicotinamide) nucleotide adenylyltransferase [Flavobacterium sp.]
MKIGLYFGTFNPIHIGHLIIANYMVEFSDLDQVWLVVTPHNPFKDKKTLLDNHLRLEMVHLATKNYPKLKPSNIEFGLPQPNYTIHTLVHLKEKYPNHQFSIIMGEDNLKSFPKWKNYEAILEHYGVYVYPRIDTNNPLSSTNEKKILEHSNIHLVDAPIVELSATFIRESIKNNKNIAPMLPEEVWKYIDHNLLYKK